MYKTLLSITALVSVLFAQWSEVHSFNTFINSISTNGNTVVVSTQGNGLLSSTDMSTWDNITVEGLPNIVGKIAFNNGELSVISTFTSGIFQYSNNTWTQTSNLPASNIQDFATFGNTFLVATTSGLFLTEDSQIWFKVLDACCASLLVKDNMIYVSSYDKGVWISSNLYMWTEINNGLTTLQGNKLGLINSKVMLGTNAGLFALNGDQWSLVGFDNIYISNFATAGTYSLVTSSTNGVYSTTDGINFASLNESIPDSAIYSITVNATDIYVGGAKGSLYKRSIESLNPIISINTINNQTTDDQVTKTKSNNKNKDKAKDNNKDKSKLGKALPTIASMSIDNLASVQIYNVQGKLIKSFANVPSQHALSALATGNYIQVIKYNGLKPVSKMVTIK